MHEPSDQPLDPRVRHLTDYEDPHFHDDEEISVPPMDEDIPHGERLPVKRRTARQLPTRRHYED